MDEKALEESKAEAAPDEFPPLTPYVATLCSDTDVALRDLLGVPASVPISRASKGDETGWPLHVVIGEGDDRLELDVFDVPGTGWFGGAHFSASYRKFRDGRDPFSVPGIGGLLKQLRARLVAVDAEISGDVVSPRWVRVRDALATERRFNGVRDDMLREVSPREALVRLGFRCNQRCDFCWQNRDWPEPPADMYRTWIREIAARGIKRITFSGGEPTLHRDLVELVRMSRDLGMAVTLQSNCIRMAKPGFAAELAAAGVDKIFASYHSHVPEISDEMTRAPRTHGRTVLGIAACIDAGIFVEINAVIERRNVAQLEGYAAHVLSSFAQRGSSERPGFAVHLSHPCAGYEGEPWEHNMMPLDEVQPHLVGALRQFVDAGVMVAAVGTCGFPPCLVAEVPEVLRALDRSIQAEGDVSGRSFVPECEACAFRGECLGVRHEYMERFGARGIRAFAVAPESSPPAVE